MTILRILAAAILCAAFSSPAFARCDQNGVGNAEPGTAKGDMNILKNRSDAPDTAEEVSVDDILGYADEEIKNLEKKGVVLKGQLLQRVHEGSESPNCGDETDYHIFIGQVDKRHPNGTKLTLAAIKRLKKKSIVVELTPNIEDKHPEWGDNLKSLPGKNVCITGWLMYDFEHDDQVGKTRGTHWEVHPVTAIGTLKADGSCEEWE